MSQVVGYREDIGVVEWAEKHNLHHEILPFQHRDNSPLYVLRHLREKFNEWPKTKQTWTQDQTDLEPNMIRPTKGYKAAVPAFLGCYKIHKDSHSRYINPDYVHAIPEQPYSTKSRIEQYLFWAQLGMYSLADLGEMYCIGKQSVQEYVAHRGYSWRAERNKGKLRFARTMETIKQWADTDFAELARLFGIPRTTLYDWRKNIVQPIPNRPKFKR